MARKIDEDKPLDKADRKWLESWGRQDVIDRVDTEHGVAEVDDGEDREPTTRDDLIAVLCSHGINPGDDPVAAVDAALSDKKAEDSQSESEQDVPFAESADEESDEDDTYEDWSVSDLRSELGKRELSKSGTKPELVSRLEESDAP